MGLIKMLFYWHCAHLRGCCKVSALRIKQGTHIVILLYEGLVLLVI